MTWCQFYLTWLEISGIVSLRVLNYSIITFTIQGSFRVLRRSVTRGISGSKERILSQCQLMCCFKFTLPFCLRGARRKSVKVVSKFFIFGIKNSWLPTSVICRQFSLFQSYLSTLSIFTITGVITKNAKKIIGIFHGNEILSIKWLILIFFT